MRVRGAQVGQPAGIEQSLRVASRLLFHQPQETLQQPQRVPVPQPVRRVQQGGYQVLLTVGVAHPCIPPNPRQPPVREDHPPHHLPQRRFVMVQ